MARIPSALLGVDDGDLESDALLARLEEQGGMARIRLVSRGACACLASYNPNVP